MDELLADGDRRRDGDRSSRAASDSLAADVERLELATLLAASTTTNDAIATLHAGAGGTESQDWAEMLLRMYLRWAEREGLDVEVDETLFGEEAGIKSATFIVHGTNAYGLLSAERGVHRLVRISPVRRAEAPAHVVRQPRRDPAARARRRGGHRDRPEGPADRRLPLDGPGRTVREHDGLRRADHAPADRDHRRVSERAVAAAEPRRRDADPEGAAGRADARGAAGEAGEPARRAQGDRLRLADPLLRARAVPDGEGPPDRPRDRRRRPRPRRRPRRADRGRAPAPGGGAGARRRSAAPATIDGAARDRAASARAPIHTSADARARARSAARGRPAGPRGRRRGPAPPGGSSRREGPAPERRRRSPPIPGPTLRTTTTEGALGARRRCATSSGRASGYVAVPATPGRGRLETRGRSRRPRSCAGRSPSVSTAPAPRRRRPPSTPARPDAAARAPSSS